MASNSEKSMAAALGATTGVIAGAATSGSDIVKFAENLKKAGEVAQEIEKLAGEGTFLGFVGATILAGVIVGSVLKGFYK